MVQVLPAGAHILTYRHATILRVGENCTLQLAHSRQHLLDRILQCRGLAVQIHDTRKEWTSRKDHPTITEYKLRAAEFPEAN